MSGVQVASLAGYEPRPPSRNSRPASRRSNQSSRPESQSGRYSSSSSRGASPQVSNLAYSGSDRQRPSSVRSLQEKRELSAYLAPLVKTAVRRWKRFHEQRVLERYKERKDTKKRKVESIKEEKQKLARKVPIDTLALQWLNTNQMTVDTRAYLLDKLLPTLILGIEKLLREAEKKGLTESNESSPDFNPINYLAQYLMRNNPRYSNFPEASPYIRGLREVTEELKKHVFSFEDNRLAKIKSEARKRREELEKQLAMKDKERGRRSARVRKQYTEWLLGEQEAVEMQFVQTALKSFEEVVESTHADALNVSIVTNIMSELENVENSEEQLDGEEFVKFMRSYFADLPTDLFNELMTHMSNCASSYRHSAILEARRELLSEIFDHCDHSGVGLLDRHRVLSLFEHFWDEAVWEIKRHLKNPRKWPVVELDETDDTDSMISSEGSHLSQLPETESVDGGTPTKDETIAEEEQKDSKEPLYEVKESSDKPEDREGGVPGPGVEGEGKESGKDDEEAGDVTGSKPEQSQGEVESGKGEETATVEQDVDEERKEEGEELSKVKGDSSDVGPATEGGEADQERAEKGELSGEVGEPELEKEATEEVHVTGEAKEAVEDVTTDEEKGHEAMPDQETPKDMTAAVTDEDEVKPPVAGPPVSTAADRPTSVSFDEDAIKRQEHASYSQSRLAVKTPVTNRSGSIAASAFDENFLNQSQFILLVEAFLGEEANQAVIDALVNYLKEGYIETEEEKFLRLQKARKEAQSAKRRLLFEQLFEKWDNDGSGYLEFEELMSVISKFKENMESKIIAKAKSKIAHSLVDNRISQHDFKIFINELCSLLPGGEDNFDPIIDFLMTSIERSYEERIRGQARKKWLTQIIQSAWTSGASMTPVFKSLFNSLYKDAEQHGRSKRISASVALVEKNDTAPRRGKTCLKYVAATPDDAHLLLNKCLYRDMKGISFSSVDSGKPIHVPRVQNHGNIMFWNPERGDEERQGSFIVIPLKDFKKRVFGVLGIDTISDMQEKSIFITHEISFFQGVGKAFSQSYQYVDVRRKTLRITESAIAWIHRRSPNVDEITVYLVEPDEKVFDRKAYRRQPIKNKKMLQIFVENNSKMDDSVLRKMMSSNKSGQITLNDSPVRLNRKENLFRDYLFKCMDNSETVTADAYGQRHTAFPLRDPGGVAVAVIDISIGDHKQLPNHENKEVQRMLKLLQSAHRELSTESEGGDKKLVLEAEKRSEESRIDIMFDRIMLTDLRDTVGKLTTRAFAELKSYKDPPKVIHDIVGSVLHLFYQDKEDDLEVWHTCKQYVNPDLVKKIQEFDPTASNALGAVEKIAWRLKDVPHGAVAKHGSLPAQHLYNWAFVCLSLLEHTSKSLGASSGGAMTPVGSVHSDGAPIEQ